MFVVSGTNDNRTVKEGILRIGSPADSLNSIVVNSARRDGTPASYSRKGNVLSFFNKPDVAYYGGDYDERIKAYSSNGDEDNKYPYANRPIMSYGDRLWGISVTSKERLKSRTQGGLNFRAVITLREINGVNRIQDFITACTLRGWIVNELDIENRVELYNANQEEIVFE